MSSPSMQGFFEKYGVVYVSALVLFGLFVVVFFYNIGAVREADAQILQAIAERGLVALAYKDPFSLHSIYVYRLPYIFIGGLSYLFGANIALYFIWMLFGGFTIFAFALLIREFSKNILVGIGCLFLYLTNTRVISIGSFALFQDAISPQFIAQPFVLFAMYTLLSRKWRLLMASFICVLFIHFPSGFYLGLFLLVFFIFNFDEFVQIFRNRVTFFICSVLFTGYIFLLVSTHDVRGIQEYSSMELFKLMSYGHVSIVANFQIAPRASWFSVLSFCVFFCVAIYSLIEWPFRNQKVIFFIFVYSFIAYGSVYVFVDVFKVGFVYRLVPLYFQFFVSLSCILVLAAITECVLSIKQNKRYLVFLITLLFLTSTANFFSVRNIINRQYNVEWVNLANQFNKLNQQKWPLVLFPLSLHDSDAVRFNARSVFRFKWVQFLGVTSSGTDVSQKLRVKIADFIGPRFLDDLVYLVANGNYRGALVELHGTLDRAWSELDEKKLQRLCDLYGFEYIIREASQRLSLRTIVESENWIIFASPCFGRQ